MFCRIIWVYMSVGIWVYPLLGRFSAAGLVGFFFFNMSVVILLYLLGNELSRRVWGKRSYVCHIIPKKKGLKKQQQQQNLICLFA